MKAHTPPVVDERFVERVINATAIKALIDDHRWGYVLTIIEVMRLAAENRAKIARRQPSLDGMVKATHFDGQVTFAEALLQTFKRSYQYAEVVLEEAVKIMPHAPSTEGKPRGEDAAPQGTPAQEA